ncbi:hypothetical protein V8E36_002661 [Tilletia maclaganii]
MPKRKREEVDTPTAAVDVRKLASKLHHHLRVLKATAKRARTFETQRTVKKLKSATNDDAESGERELALLKAADTANIAAKALLAKCIKSRLLPKANAATQDQEAEEAEYPLLAAIRSEKSIYAVWTALRSSTGSVTAGDDRDKAADKVHARLASSKLLAEEVGKVVQDLNNFIHPKPAAAEAASSKADKDAAEVKEGQPTSKAKEKKAKDESSTEKTAVPASKAESARAKSTSKDAAAQRREIDDEADDPADEDATAHNPNADEDESGDDEQNGEDDINSDVYNDDPDGSKGDDDDDDDDSGHNLPALSSGFVARGLSFRNNDRGSDSDYSGGTDDDMDDDYGMDLDENAEENAAVGVDGKKKSAGKEKGRKNRMGQRARQALWEKKYGRNARHIAILKREPRASKQSAPAGGGGGRRGRPPTAAPTTTSASSLQQPVNRDQGWATARGKALAPQPVSNVGSAAAAAAVNGPRTRRFAPTTAASSADSGYGAQRGSRGPPSGTRAAPTAPPTTTAAAAAHPSWVAKQKQKEQLSQALSLKPVGKKVVFD